jgi:hypothetical protein
LEGQKRNFVWSTRRVHQQITRSLQASFLHSLAPNCSQSLQLHSCTRVSNAAVSSCHQEGQSPYLSREGWRSSTAELKRLGNHCCTHSTTRQKSPCSRCGNVAQCLHCYFVMHARENEQVCQPNTDSPNLCPSRGKLSCCCWPLARRQPYAVCWLYFCWHRQVSSTDASKWRLELPASLQQLQQSSAYWPGCSRPTKAVALIK